MVARSQTIKSGSLLKLQRLEELDNSRECISEELLNRRNHRGNFRPDRSRQLGLGSSINAEEEVEESMHGK